MASLPDDVTFEHASPLTAPVLDVKTTGLPEKPTASEAELRRHADVLAEGWEPLSRKTGDADLAKWLTQLSVRLKERLRLCRKGVDTKKMTPQLELLESSRMFEAVIQDPERTQEAFKKMPYARMLPGGDLPQVIHLAVGYVGAANGIWSAESLGAYVQQVQRHHPLLLQEVLLLPEAVMLAQLEFLLNLADDVFETGELIPIERSPFSAPIHSLRRLGQYKWTEVLESLVAFDGILRQDPTRTFAQMDEETRRAYHLRVAELARHADASEVETAQIALDLARKASKGEHSDPRLAQRKMHIGYYLLAEGATELCNRIGYHPPEIERLRDFIRQRNEEFYILGTFTISVLLITVVILPLIPHHDFWAVIGALLFALLPATQGAADLVNGAVSVLFKTRALPKLDFKKGVPGAATTLVVVPTLLLKEEQVGDLIQELEARYLSNQEPNLHFGLLTDLPDTAARPLAGDRSPLVDLALRSIDELNAKYAGQKGGSFFLLHRHRVFNARQGVWMGWERKRGKLLDLNKFLLHEFDSFPIKAGPLQVLDRVRYVITLDSDTQLPRGTAARMIGTIAHPLNQAIINPRSRIVTAGYGLLQPRVGVSVASASRSRLAALYSGETGFDIYTRAVSDVYQDLFGEGIFTGKGVYEVGVFHKVLDRRFPRNALLSHDLIEGAYVRAGLVTDIEVIDDYPSHYMAHTRRKHRWVRGDWQITRWLFNSVPDESGRLVPNPISTISRWKIFDNLRRSLIEPITFLLFVFGWFFLPGGALYWTLAVLFLLVLPGIVQLGFKMGRAAFQASLAAAQDGLSTFASSIGITLLNLTFLPHHMMLSLDAIFRSLSRTLISGKNLLDWETAAQSEEGRSVSSLDSYLKLSPAIALAIAAALALLHPRALLPASPVLVLWALAPAVARWLDSSPHRVEGPLTPADKNSMQQYALQTWRYFAEFGGAENHWLIPDNVEEKDTLQVRKLSPTNLGMLLNARQCAYELGFTTLPEFARATLGTLTTYEGLEKQHGHIYNWYDIETLQAIAPFIVSAVDSGNLAASFYTLSSGSLDLLKRSLFPAQAFMALNQESRERVEADGGFSVRGLVRRLVEEVSSPIQSAEPDGWLGEEWVRRRSSLGHFVTQYMPWLLPKFDPLFDKARLAMSESEQIPTLQDATEYVGDLQKRLEGLVVAQGEGVAAAGLAMELRSQLSPARERLSQLRRDVATIATKAQQFADAMDFGFLLVESRQLLSIGYDGATGELNAACYDLLASEARIASFLAVAKGDIPQEAWFRLDRSHVLVHGRATLISWTGTMFEYMMPALWMRSYPDTLITRSLEAVVRIQRDHVREIPWGISESGFAKTDAQGRYGYHAWGVPELALKYGADDGPVISPYSTFLAAPFLRSDALKNLRSMAMLNWVGAYGFYEAADYIEGEEPKLVRSWMAHHQGMSLLAITNLLRDNIVQNWFHASPLVRAAELLLHERSLDTGTVKALAKRSRMRPNSSKKAADEAL
jgi:cyclic beta-1,2-glucan synthetase